jgi:hypothetical protein
MLLEILKTKPHNLHYLNRYIKFIQRYANIATNEKIEAHHICPKSSDLFPEFKSFKKHPWNKANLTLRQHYIAHKLLWKAYGGRQAQAFKLMCERLKFNTSKCYEEVRREHIAYMTNHNHNADGGLSKKAWESATVERRIRQSEIMRKINETKKKPKESREYKCPQCSIVFLKVEFCHHPENKKSFCSRSCSVIFSNKNRIRNPTEKSNINKKSTEKSNINKKPHPWTLPGRKAWNKGLSNPTAAENGRKSATKQSATVTGRKRKYLPDGSWTWQYPKK